MAPLSYPGLLDLTLECHGQHLCSYEVIGNGDVSVLYKEISLSTYVFIPAPLGSLFPFLYPVMLCHAPNPLPCTATL